jgi:hypothetical protein
LPPNETAISKVTWVTHFAGEKIPSQDVIVANLARKYGPSLVGHRTGRVDDRYARCVPGLTTSRKQGQTPAAAALPRPKHVLHERAEAGTRNQLDPTNVRLPVSAARLRIEQGFVNREDLVAAQCSPYAMVHARLFKTSVMGVRVPNLVGIRGLVSGQRSARPQNHQAPTNIG